jgi:hypothetical protein
MLSSFIRFPRLPTELRLKIWQYAADETYELHERRVIRIDHEPTPNAAISRDSIHEDLPGLIGACHESREVSFTDYCMFDYKNASWIMPSLDANQLREILSKLYLPDVQPRRFTFYIARLRSAIITHMNEHRTDPDQKLLFSAFALKSMPIGPRWFNPDHDIMLLKPNRGYSAHDTWESGLWTHANPEAQKMKHLAFELGSLRYPQKEHLYFSVSDRTPTRAPLNHLDAVESITLLCMETCEVIIVTLDDRLLYETWTYSLDIESRAFKNQMGNRWTNVTWRVKLPLPFADTFHDERQDLWEAFVCWHPDIDVWLNQKFQLCQNEPSVLPQWLTCCQLLLDETSDSRLILHTDGKSYVGATAEPINELLFET